MTVGILCLDGLDWRLASKVGLFDDVPVDGQRLENDLDGDRSLFTPRVWTSIMAGTDQARVLGWLPADDWHRSTDGLSMFWDHFPGTKVHDLRVHRSGLTQSDVMPTRFTESTNSVQGLQDTAMARATYWNEELSNDPQAVVAWFGFPDRSGHLAGQRQQANLNGADLRPAYEWMRDKLFPMLTWPDDVVVISDHGFRIPEWNADWDGSWAGRQAHAPDGTLATSSSAALKNLRDFDTLTDFIPSWQAFVAQTMRNRNLRNLGYR